MYFESVLFIGPYIRSSIRCIFCGIMLALFLNVITCDSGHAGIGVRLSNDMIENCVARPGDQNSQPLNCIGHFSKPCRARSENTHPDSQEECLEHEFVLWDQLMRKTLAKFKDAIKSEQTRVKVQEAHDVWKTYHELECRLPYSLLPPNFTAKEFGLNCSIQLTARRVSDLMKLQNALGMN